MFGRDQNQSKIELVKKFAKKRLEKLMSNNSEFEFQSVTSGLSDIDNWDSSFLEGLPESTIITIVESYFEMKNRGINNSKIFENIELHRESFDPFPNPNPMPSSPNLKNYIYYRLEFELPIDAGFNIGENGITRDYIEQIIDEASINFS